MKIIRFVLILSTLLVVQVPLNFAQDTWANWERRLRDGFSQFNPRNLPGQSMGILLPSDPRHDLLPLTTHGYQVLDLQKSDTLIILLKAPENYPVNGIVMPAQDTLLTSFGYFQVDTHLRDSLQNIDFPIFVDETPFGPTLPDILLTQLACVKYMMHGKLAHVKFLPIMVKFNDPNSMSKDLGPFIAENIKDMGLKSITKIVALGNLSSTTNPKKIIELDNIWLNAIRNLDLDSLIRLNQESKTAESNYSLPDLDPLLLGLQTLQWMGGDHGEVLAYSHSGQLVLTKNKKHPIGYVAAGVASDPPYPPRIPHMKREKLVDTFDELFRSDILTLTRQTLASIVDLTAAKPPSLLQKQAKKKWPIYVSLYDGQGQLRGEAGTHVGKIPLEEALRRYTFEAVQQAKKHLTKDNMNSYVVEVSIPYGFGKVGTPEDLIPLLNGLVVLANHKSYGFHPNRWRTYPNAHQLLSAICFQLGLKPWAYATEKAVIKSFRVMSFNEKEPFQDLGAHKRKKKKKKGGGEDEFSDDEDFGGDIGDFTF